MVQSVMFEDADPATAAKAAQEQVMKVLNWPEGTSVTLEDDKGGACSERGHLVPALTPVQKSADKDGSGQVCSVLGG
jgi:hypothetical protein